MIDLFFNFFLGVADVILRHCDKFATKKKDVVAERFLSSRMTFSQSLMVSVGVSKLDYTGLILADPGVKISEICYCDLFLS